MPDWLIPETSERIKEFASGLMLADGFHIGIHFDPNPVLLPSVPPYNDIEVMDSFKSSVVKNESKIDLNNSLMYFSIIAIHTQDQNRNVNDHMDEKPFLELYDDNYDLIDENYREYIRNLLSTYIRTNYPLSQLHNEFDVYVKVDLLVKKKMKKLAVSRILQKRKRRSKRKRKTKRHGR